MVRIFQRFVGSFFRKFRGSFQSLYAGIQCSSCGSRFTPERMDRYREHLDWHFRQNKREKQQIKVGPVGRSVLAC